MNRAIKYRIYPTEEQKILLSKTFGCCRKVWNLMLSDKISSYQETGKFEIVTPARYKSEYPFLKEVDSLALANVQLNLQSAFRNRFDKSRKTRNRFPKFKSKKHAKKSYTTNNQKGSIRFVDDRFLRLPKLGNVKAVFHRMPEEDWVLKSVTVSMDSDEKYYASVLFSFDLVINPIVPDSCKAIGLDYSSSHLFIDNNGNTGSNHKYYKESHAKLAKEQRRLSRKIGNEKNQIKSKNYWKQLQKINKIHRHIANQRKDHLHKLSAEITNQYDIICVEDLNMKTISNKGFHNGKATMDNGYGMFLTMLKYKMEACGKYFVKVGKWYPSSQICSCCGTKNPKLKNLNIREWDCQVCGSHHDRDTNAAKNILNEGLRLLFESGSL